MRPNYPHAMARTNRCHRIHDGMRERSAGFSAISVDTRTFFESLNNLIRIHKALRVSGNIKSGTEALVAASRIYDRVTWVTATDSPKKLDQGSRKTLRGPEDTSL